MSLDTLTPTAPATAESAYWPDTAVFRGYSAPVRLEVDICDLEVVGTIPEGFDGAYIRNCADHAYPPMYADDIFINGDGMLHKIRFKNGRASLQTRYVQTEKLRLEREAGRALFGIYRNPFTDDPSVAGKNRSTANTSVIYHAGKLFATKEAAKPVLINPDTLGTLGEYDFGGKLKGDSFTAHAKLDPRTGEMIGYGYFTDQVADTKVEIYYVDASGELSRTEIFDQPYPSMIHDFLVSENYVIFVIYPMVCDWERVKAGKPFFHWDDRLPTKVAVIPRAEGGTKSIRWFTAPKPVMETHTFNAWEDGALLHLEHFGADNGWLSQFPDINNPDAKEAPHQASRWTIDLSSNEDTGFTSEPLFPDKGEMPMIDLRHAMRRTRHFWFGTANTDLGPMLPWGSKGPPFTCIGHFDADTGKRDYYYAGPRSAPEEPIFVPRSADAEEGDGWIMTVVGRYDENRSDFVILDARNLSAGPVATVRMPCRIHEGFHAIWMPGSALSD